MAAEYADDFEPAAGEKVTLFAGTASVPTKRHRAVPPPNVTAQAIRQREGRCVAHAREQLAKRAALLRQEAEEAKKSSDKKAVPQTPGGGKAAKPSRLVAPPTPLPSASGPRQVASSTVFGVAFAGTPDQMKELVEKAGDKYGVAPHDFVNSVGYVDVCHNEYGLKVSGKEYRLGFGSKACPLHFACLACRADMASCLLALGAKWRKEDMPHGLPTPCEVAASGKCEVIVDIFKHLQEMAHGEKPTPKKPTPKQL